MPRKHCYAHTKNIEDRCFSVLFYSFGVLCRCPSPFILLRGVRWIMLDNKVQVAYFPWYYAMPECLGHYTCYLKQERRALFARV